MNKAIVTLKKGEGRMLKSGGAWIFDNEIESVMGNFDDGDIVLVHDFDGYPLGRGLSTAIPRYGYGCWTRNIDQEINEAFFAKGFGTHGNIGRRLWIFQAAVLCSVRRISCREW